MELLTKLRRTHRILVFGTTLLLGFFLAGLCVPAVALEAGQKASSPVQLGGMSIPLPDGEWSVYYAVENEDAKFQTSKLGLVLISGTAIKQFVYLRVLRSKTGGGFRAYGQCTQPYFFYGETAVNQTSGAQDCWNVAVETLAPDKPSDRQKALLEFAKSHNLFLPLATIGPRFHKASADVLLQASFGWTPDLIIKAPSDTKVWKFQDWTAEAVAKDLRKKVIMNKMKRWGEEWRPHIEDAFASFRKK